ncbi:hypothetical protein AS156_03495 [Bradyrhizobium macuxiense]|uniref:Uncharacterized protein n=1 Tax=Bradyrhizobium macuxiense TaxID=1755647 RepID=A0A109JXR8_9BRAD|nr:hypothetical protein AS156_03495 [Bradyrhizobium macuxiense]
MCSRLRAAERTMKRGYYIHWSSSLSAYDEAILANARMAIARSLEILRNSQPGTFLGHRRHGTSARDAQEPADGDGASRAMKRE